MNDFIYNLNIGNIVNQMEDINELPSSVTQYNADFLLTLDYWVRQSNTYSYNREQDRINSDNFIVIVSWFNAQQSQNVDSVRKSKLNSLDSSDQESNSVRKYNSVRKSKLLSFDRSVRRFNQEQQSASNNDKNFVVIDSLFNFEHPSQDDSSNPNEVNF